MAGRGCGAGGSFAAASREPAPQLGGDRGPGAGGACRRIPPGELARSSDGCIDRGVATPAVSTVHEILRRHGRIDPLGPSADPAPLRFEKAAPNLLWQMDFKGWITLSGRERCHPLTIIDDHSRFVPCLQACADQQTQTVQTHLETTFRRYGLPEAIFVDNGSPWGDASGERWTRLGVWLLKLGVKLIYSRPYHPQSRGKNERFHRTLKAEVFALRRFSDFAQVQRAFDTWREVYNFERPHEALGQATPASRLDVQRQADAQAPARGRVRRRRDRPHRLLHQGLHQLQGPALESPTGLPPRARRHQAADVRRRLRNTSTARTRSPPSIFASQALLTAENGLDRLDAPS